MSTHALDLLLRILLAPVLIGLASLAGRRWGPSISGWLVGLPMTSGPIALLLTLQHGNLFAAADAAGTLAGGISQVAFCLGYVFAARRFGWAVATLAGSVSFAVLTLLLRPLAGLDLWLLTAVTVAVLVVGLWLLPTGAVTDAARRVPPKWDLPARMVLVTVFVVALTGASSTLGPALTGLVAPFPLFATILTIFAHQQEGQGAAGAVLRGLVLGLFSFVAFFVLLAALLPVTSVAISFVVATLGSLALQGASLWLLRRRIPEGAQGRGSQVV